MKRDDEILRVNVVDLASYNNGLLVEKWISLPNDELEEEVQLILERGRRACRDVLPHEEVAIFDFEWLDAGMGKACSVNEYSDLHKLNEMAEELSALEEFERLRVQFLLYEGYEFEYALENYEDVTIYDFRNSTSFTDIYELLAEELVNDGCFGEIPDALIHYLDYSKIGRDLSFDYTEFEHGLLGRAS
jgi:antirestriction protein